MKRQQLEKISDQIEENLKKSHPDFADMETILGGNNFKLISFAGWRV